MEKQEDIENLDDIHFVADDPQRATTGTTEALGLSDRLLEFSPYVRELNAQPSNTSNQSNLTSNLDKKIIDINDSQPKVSLFRHPKVPVFWRYALPCCLTLNTILLLCSNASRGATVASQLKFFGLQRPMNDVKAFSLTNTVHDMWKAGVYPLALLIAVFSGAWPYLKLFAMFACWFINERKMSYRWREKFLIILDTMGKWSLIDAYVLVLMIMAFRFQLGGAGTAVSFFQLDIIVLSNFGFYSFIVATIASLVWTHIIIHYHRSVNERPLQHSDKKKPLCYKNKLKKMFVLIVLIMCILLLCVGACINSFTFTFKGAAGWALGKNASVDYSLLSLGSQIPSKTMDPNSFGTRFIQITYLLFAFVLPLCFLLMLGTLWVVPMRITLQRKLFTVAEMLNAWSTIDVFVISIIAALLEIKQFAAFIIGDSCNVVNEWLVVIDQFGLVDLHGQDYCFEVDTSLRIGCSVLFIAALLYFILGTTVLRRCQSQIEKRVKNIEVRDEKVLQEQQEEEEIGTIPNLNENTQTRSYFQFGNGLSQNLSTLNANRLVQHSADTNMSQPSVLSN